MKLISVIMHYDIYNTRSSKSKRHRIHVDSDTISECQIHKLRCNSPSAGSQKVSTHSLSF